MKWIKIEDEMPPIDTDVLFRTPNGEICIGLWFVPLGLEEVWFVDDIGVLALKPTHWMPLPDKPDDL